jgi:hypothetical protein
MPYDLDPTFPTVREPAGIPPLLRAALPEVEGTEKKPAYPPVRPVEHPATREWLFRLVKRLDLSDLNVASRLLLSRQRILAWSIARALAREKPAAEGPADLDTLLAVRPLPPWRPTVAAVRQAVADEPRRKLLDAYARKVIDQRGVQVSNEEREQALARFSAVLPSVSPNELDDRLVEIILDIQRTSQWTAARPQLSEQYGLGGSPLDQLAFERLTGTGAAGAPPPRRRARYPRAGDRRGMQPPTTPPSPPSGDLTTTAVAYLEAKVDVAADLIYRRDCEVADLGLDVVELDESQEYDDDEALRAAKAIRILAVLAGQAGLLRAVRQARERFQRGDLVLTEGEIDLRNALYCWPPEGSPNAAERAILHAKLGIRDPALPEGTTPDRDSERRLVQLLDALNCYGTIRCKHNYGSPQASAMLAIATTSVRRHLAYVITGFDTMRTRAYIRLFDAAVDVLGDLTSRCAAIAARGRTETLADLVGRDVDLVSLQAQASAWADVFDFATAFADPTGDPGSIPVIADAVAGAALLSPPQTCPTCHGRGGDPVT